MKRIKLLPLLLVLALVLFGQILTAQQRISDDSNSPFSILAQMVTVLSPNGGENWNAGTIHNITWSLTSSITNVDIAYSTDGGNTWIPVVANTPNNSTYAWAVPSTPSTTCLVRVNAAGSVGNNDISDRFFFISSASTETVTTPNQPTGPVSGFSGSSYQFSCSGANLNTGDALQYRFDWGDGGDSGWRAAGTATAAHAWAASGVYQVRAKARCATHTSVESPWSDPASITISAGITSLKWNTFLGGNSYDYGNGIAVDCSGNIYVVGTSQSTWGSPLNPFAGGYDAFVAKLNPDCSLQWMTFLGSSSYDAGTGIAVDSSGNIYVTGYSGLTWGSPLNPHAGANSNVFVAKLNPNGSLQWNTFLGASYSYGDQASGIVVDNSGNIYITGDSPASWGNPLNPFSGSTGYHDAFVAKLNPNGSRQWHTFLDGSDDDFGKGIALDNSGNIYVAGSSSITWGNPLNPFAGGSSDVFLVKLNSSGARQWNTFLGGNGSDFTWGRIAVDGSGNIFVTGRSDSSWGSPINPHYGNGDNDAFVAKFNTSGSLQWNTFLGGSGSETGWGITVDKSGNIFTTGDSSSSWGSPLNPFNGGTTDIMDVFLVKLNPNGTLQLNTFLGGNGNDEAKDIASDSIGNILITGWSPSTWGNPLNPFTKYYDIFVAKLNFGANNLAVFSPNGGENWFSGSSRNITWDPPASIGNVNIEYSVNNGSSWTPVAANIANNGSYVWTLPATPSANCLVRVSDADNSSTFDVSDAVFTISIPDSLTVISPNGGENWAGGSAQNITWSSTGTIANVNIDYSTNNGSTWTPVASNISNSGNYAWTVPATPSTNCLVRVSNAANAGIYDISDAIFSISVETITAPAQPSGSASGFRNTSFSFSSGGSNSSFGHEVQYRFDWGDGTDSGWLAVGTTSANHVWTVTGAYQVRAMARCATHTSVESPWSVAHTIIIYDAGIPILQWNTFLGGIESDSPGKIVLDGEGNIYVTGSSNATWGSPLNSFSGVIDAFLAKFNADGVLQWNTFFGSGSTGSGIALDSSGNIYITGYSISTWGSPLNSFNGGQDAFVAKFNSNGGLQWHTFLGGNDYDYGNDIAVDSNGNIYIAGQCAATWGNPLNPFSGSVDALVAKLNPNGSLQWHTFLGGSDYVSSYGLFVDSNGNIFLTGESDSTWGNPLHPFSGGDGADVFVAKLSTSGVLQWHTFLGGSDPDIGNDIALDNSGNIYITGISTSTWGTPLNPHKGGGITDGFAAKLNPSGVLQWNTFLGGSGGDSGRSITVDSSGNIFIIGDSDSTWGIPLHPFTGDGYIDVFVAKLTTSGILQWNTFLGGSFYDCSSDISLDYLGNIIINGFGYNSWGNPLNPPKGNSDVFLAKLFYRESPLTVIAPNGGENWTAGSSQNITWRSIGSTTNVNIDYSTNNGNSWTPVAANTANSGIYAWTVPATPSTNCLLRISDAATTADFDVSDAKFTISPTTFLTVVSPNGGETRIRGSVYAIRWTANNVANVKIELLKAGALNSTITSSTSAASGSYNWTIPSTQTVGSDYKIRLTSTASSSITDSSDANFSIAAPFVTVTTPNGGEQWQRGTTQTIAWTSGGVTNVKIELMKGTSVNSTISSSTAAAAGSYNWAIPSTQTVGSDYKIRLTSTASSTVTDSSNANFAIFAPTITVTSPVAGNTWVKNTLKTITWTKTGTMNSNVKIQLYSGTTKKLDITLSTENDGAFDWLIPSTLANGTYTIKITTVDNLVTGSSASFTVVAGLITVTAPAASAKWQRGVAHTITWTSEGTLNANVKIQLLKGTAVDSTIVSTTPNNGSYTWAIPANKTLATNYKIRVTTVDSLVTGDSGVFSITSTSALKLQVPNGNERLAALAIYPISWTRRFVREQK